MSQMKLGALSPRVLSHACKRGRKKAKPNHAAVLQSVNTKKGKLSCLNLLLKRFWKPNLFCRFEG